MNSVIGNPPERPKSRTEEVLVTVTLSKVCKIVTDNYTINSEGIDEDGYFLDIVYHDLEDTVKEQILLPNDGYLGWDMDNLEVQVL